MEQKNLVEELKAVQEQIAAGETVCNEIRAKLVEVEDQQSAAHVAERNMPQLLQRKEDLQADIAMGATGKQKELDQVNKDIAKAQQDVEYHNQTVSGLSRRLQEAESGLEQLRHRKVVLVESWVRNEAERIQAEAMEHARGFLSRFKQLQALVHIHDRVKGHTDPIGNGMEHQFLSIPVFRLESAGQHSSDPSVSWPEWQPARVVKSGCGVAAEDLAAEQARLAGMGLQV